MDLRRVVAVLREHDVVGAGLVVVRPGARDTAVCVGEQRLGEVPVSNDTIFHWASITKTLTSVAIMQLRDDGQLRLDDSATKYLPEMRAISNPFGSMDDVTVLHLLTHTSGLPAASFPWGGDKAWHPMEPHEYSQIVAMLPYVRLAFAPGCECRCAPARDVDGIDGLMHAAYSNLAFLFLGEIVRVIAREPFQTYVWKNVLLPLDMRRSFFDTTPRLLLRHRACSYWIDDDGNVSPARFDASSGATVANSGLNAPLSDIAKFVRFLLHALPPAASCSTPDVTVDDDDVFVEECDGAATHAHGDDTATRYAAVLAPETLREMWQPRAVNRPWRPDRDADGAASSGDRDDGLGGCCQCSTEDCESEEREGGDGGAVELLLEGGAGCIGLGFFLQRCRGVQLIGHSGEQNGFVARLFVNRDGRWGYVAAYNSMSAAGGGRRRGNAKAADAALRDLLCDMLQ